MKKLHEITLIILAVFALAGCEKQTVEKTASADVLVKAIKNAAGNIVYTTIHSVFSYNKMTSVTVLSPSGKTQQLINFANAGNSFFNQPAESEYTTTPPPVGTFNYSVKFDGGEEKVYNNSLSSAIVQPAEITSLAKNAMGDSVYIYWKAIADADGYQMKVMKDSTQIYYQQPFQDVSNPKKLVLRLGLPIAVFSTTGPGTYTFEISGLLYESTAYQYLQAISTSSQNIVL